MSDLQQQPRNRKRKRQQSTGSRGTETDDCYDQAHIKRTKEDGLPVTAHEASIRALRQTIVAALSKKHISELASSSNAISMLRFGCAVHGISSNNLSSDSSRRHSGSLHSPTRAQSQQLPPWKSSATLADDISGFVDFIEATPSEVAARQDLAARLRHIVEKRFPSDGLTLYVFGSVATGCFLPTSDVDLVMMPSSAKSPKELTQGNMASKLSKLARAIYSETASGIQIIKRAKVPILKFVDAQTKLAVDLSYSTTMVSPMSVDLVKRLFVEQPALRPLTLVLKQFLTVRNLNQVFTGGIGGYALVLWISAFLRLHPLLFETVSRSQHRQDMKLQLERPAKKQHLKSKHANNRLKGRASHESPSNAASDLGILLSDFFLLFGTLFDYEQFAIYPLGDSLESILIDKDQNLKRQQQMERDAGNLYFKRSKRQRLAALSILDPNNMPNDLAQGSFAIGDIVAAFTEANTLLCAKAATLKKLAGQLQTPSPLARILHITRESTAARQTLQQCARSSDAAHDSTAE